MTRQFYIGLIAAFALGLALGAEVEHGSVDTAQRLQKVAEQSLSQAQSDRDQTYGRLDECEGILKAHSWDDAPTTTTGTFTFNEDQKQPK